MGPKDYGTMDDGLCHSIYSLWSSYQDGQLGQLVQLGQLGALFFGGGKSACKFT
jgi:hypothetical protein